MTSRYQLLGLIARGGMAEVHLARTRSEGGFTKLLALKRILETYADNPQLTAMFMDEARLAARLSHPNVVQVFDFGKDAQGYYIAMEYVPGPDLANVLRTLRHGGERPPEAPMLDVLIQVLRGLDSAHRLTGPDGLNAGVVHRDVSPGNVLLTTEGVAKLSDFGVARAAERLTEQTKAGKTKGKAAYMSPEQARSRPLDARSDVYAAGLLLWEVLAGQRCYQASDDVTLIRMAAKGEVRTLASVGVEVDPALKEILDKALQVEPEGRFKSAAEMAQALEAYHREHFPKYHPAALGQVVQRALSALPPLPHVALQTAGDEPDTIDEPPAPLPQARPSKPSVRRPRPQVEASPPSPPRASTEASRPAAEASNTSADVPSASSTPAAKASSVFSLGATVVVVALAVVAGLLYLDHKRETEVAIVNGPPQGMHKLSPPPGDPQQPGVAQYPEPGAPDAGAAPSVPAPTPSLAQHPGKALHLHGTGYLSVRCDPWCDVFIDGKPTHERSPVERMPLPAGAHALRLVNPTVNLEKRTTVTIPPHQTVSRYFNLVLDH